MTAFSDPAVARRHLGTVVSVCGSKGGVGKTLFSSGLAVVLAESGYKTVLVDLTLRLGSDLAYWLGLLPDPNFADLVGSVNNMLPDALEPYLLVHETGVRLLAAPSSPERWQRIEVGDVEKTVHLLRYRYQYVVIDLSCHFDSRMTAVLPISDRIYMLTTPDFIALQNCREMLRLFRLLGYGGQVQLVLNRHTPRETLSPGEIGEAIGHKFDHIVEEIPGQDITFCRDLLGGDLLSHLHQQFLPVAARLTGREESDTGRSSEHKLFRLFPAWTRKEREKTGTSKSPWTATRTRHEIQALIHQRVIEQVGTSHLHWPEAGGTSTAKDLKAAVMRVIDEVLAENGGNAWSLQEQQEFRQQMVDEVLGLGHVEGFLRDPTVTEIMVNGCDRVYVERNGRLELTDKQFTNNAAVIKIIERIIAPLGRRIDESSPMVDARLPDGSRVNAIIPPLALDGPMLTIRKFFEQPLSIEDLVRFGSLTEEMAEFLRRCVQARFNLIVSGGTGSGKTTLLNVLSGFIPPDERIITIEDAAELRLRQPHVGRLEARPPNIEGKGEVAIGDLLRNALRMRPDRIIVGEARGPEALDMLQAMNTGHEGSMTTAHANSPRDLLSRLETMVMMAGIDLPLAAVRNQIASALDIIIQQGRFRDGSRKITHITAVEGIYAGEIKLQPLFVFQQKGVNEQGQVEGDFVRVGNLEDLQARFEQRGA